MKIKLAYPKIPDTLGCPLKQCIAFEKLDGTNIHGVWSPETVGFHSFGTRRDRFWWNSPGASDFSSAHPEMKEIHLLLSPKWNLKMDDLLRQHFNQAKEVIVFFEFLGDNSFAGSHQPKDPKRLVVIDAQVDGVILPPDQFIKLFEPFGIPKAVFRGKFTGQLFVDVRNGKYEVKEGVVVKGVVDGKVYMCKIKTEDYLRKIKEYFPNKWKDYWE